MDYLIDGYNLLHVTNVFVNDVGPGSLSRLHAALLDFLIECMDPQHSKRTTVVFDAKGRRAATRRTVQYGGMTVHYAARTEDADTLIAELVRSHHSPRNLTVVSSDHQVQRAAKRRRAKAVDSEVWYGELKRGKRDREAKATSPANQQTTLDEHDVAWWLKQFDEELLRELEAESPKAPSPPADSAVEKSDIPITHSTALAHPFPPEYLAEVAREIERETKK